MQATELITQLTTLIREHGDLVVMDEYGRLVDNPEHIDDEDYFLISFNETDDTE